MSTTYTLYKDHQTELDITEQSYKYSLCTTTCIARGSELVKECGIQELTATQCLDIAMSLIKAVGYTAPAGFKQQARDAFEDAIEWATE